MKVIKPIIIVGTGRCGSTLFHRLLANHPQLMWLSGFTYRYPAQAGSGTAGRLRRWTFRSLRRLLADKVRPGENYRFWDHYCLRLFRALPRPRSASDVSARVKKQIHAAFEPMLSSKRDRLLIKITGWPRIGYPERDLRGRQVHSRSP